jgi:uncharacterized membrane protein YdjX (TVP38/TMEM64 family)
MSETPDNSIRYCVYICLGFIVVLILIIVLGQIYIGLTQSPLAIGIIILIVIAIIVGAFFLYRRNKQNKSQKQKVH